MVKCTRPVLLLLVCSPGALAKDRANVPDSKTALRIAEAVLDARYGEAEVAKMLPLTVRRSDGDLWIVDGWDRTVLSKGNGTAVWINRYSGALRIQATK